MTKPTILVTGASGKTGSAVVAQLCERGWPVRAMVRSRDARSERLERLGAEIAVADLFDYDALRAAMAGTSRGYFCPPFHPAYATQRRDVYPRGARNAPPSTDDIARVSVAALIDPATHAGRTDFMTVPFRPGLDPQRYAAQLSLPASPAPLYNLESEHWKLEHARAVSIAL